MQYHHIVTNHELGSIDELVSQAWRGLALRKKALVVLNISAPFPVLGKHLIADFYGASHLIDHKPAEAVFAQAAKEGGATLLGIEMHDFGVGAGFTGVAILAESHISIHTWPEHQHAAIDIFMCGDADPRLSLAVLQRYFQPAQSEVQLIERGTRASAPVGAL